MPHMLAGNRIDPPMSLPCATGTSPAATAAAEPPLDPPVLRVSSHGLRVGPYASGSVVTLVASSGVFVLPTNTKPAARKRAASQVSSGSTQPASFKHLHARVVRVARGVAHRVLHEERHARERPGRGPGASSEARSKRRWMTALRRPSMRSMRSIAASTSSRAETVAARRRARPGRWRRGRRGRRSRRSVRRSAARRSTSWQPLSPRARLGDERHETLRRRARTLAATLEPVIGQVFFSPECHAAYEKLGFAPSPGIVRQRCRRARRPGVLHQPGVAARPGRARGRRVRVRRLQAGGRRAGRALRLDAHRCADDLRARGEPARSRSSNACAVRRAPTSTRAADVARARGRAARRTRPSAVLRSARAVGRSRRRVDAALPSRRHVARVPRRRARVRVVDGGRRRDRDRSAHRGCTWACRSAPISGRAGGTTPSSTARVARLTDRGWLDDDGSLTEIGRARTRRRWSARPTARMTPAIDALGDDVDDVVAMLRPWGERCARRAATSADRSTSGRIATDGARVPCGRIARTSVVREQEIRQTSRCDVSVTADCSAGARRILVSALDTTFGDPSPRLAAGSAPVVDLTQLDVGRTCGSRRDGRTDAQAARIIGARHAPQRLNRRARGEATLTAGFQHALQPGAHAWVVSSRPTNAVRTWHRGSALRNARSAPWPRSRITRPARSRAPMPRVTRPSCSSTGSGCCR